MATKVFLRYSQPEWDQIRQKLGRASVTFFLAKKIPLLKCQHEECPVCMEAKVAKSKERRFAVSEDNVAILEALSRELKVPVATIISRLIIDPLLTA